jgi:hypothetical protein
MTDEHHGRARMPCGEVPHTRDHTRLDGREGLTAGQGTGRIRLPLLVTDRVVSAACENLGAAQTFPRPHGGFDKPWFWDEGPPVGLRYRLRRRDGPGERARVDRREIERREGLGELLRLPLATCR